jgi:O-antigen/teichoic acid export membrane protein
MVGSTVSLGFPLGISGGMLEGLQRFDVASFTSIASALLKALLIVFALRHGGGLLLVAVVFPILSSTVGAAVAFRLLPIRLSLSRVDRETFREIAGYGAPMLIMIVSARLRFKSDSVIIGAMLSTVYITYFNIGSRIVDYAGEVVDSARRRPSFPWQAMPHWVTWIVCGEFSWPEIVFAHLRFSQSAQF